MSASISCGLCVISSRTKMAAHVSKSSVEWPITGLPKLWRACPKWHAAFSVVPFFHFFSSASVSILWRICVFIRISDCVRNVYELPLLPYKTATEKFLHKSGALQSVDSRFIIRTPAWRWLGEYVTLEKTFYNLLFQQEIVTALIHFHIFYLIAYLYEPLLKM